MSNPHPTISKPNKIGRKHTRAPSERAKQLKQNGKKLWAAQKAKRAIRRKLQIEAYWRGDINEHP